MSEIWKDIPDYDGFYEVSNKGRVFSLITNKFLKFGNHKFGYFQVTLYKDKKPRNFLVQVLVAQAFIGPRPAKMSVCHNDGNCKNNTDTNLRYDTQKGNAHDRIAHGTTNRGERHGM